MSRGRKIAGGVLALFAGIGLVVAQGGGDQAPGNMTPGEPEECMGWFVDEDACELAKAQQVVDIACKPLPAVHTAVESDRRWRECLGAKADLNRQRQQLRGMSKNVSDQRFSVVSRPYAVPTERICLTYEDTNRITGETVPGRCVVRLAT
ncbi:hypothetical protein [Corynebacterium amycolatum]|uniref:hypothetical protein n=1 Tax=Corynebacterium amycolatum TaxID=43765 RepID=UPI00117A01CA|nr:hypothetical protein [Corynebacterium amycolatum]MDK7314702.1 hypothetical protein [Corynebacterium amycolatum]